jgi:hypothetical protein
MAVHPSMTATTSGGVMLVSQQGVPKRYIRLYRTRRHDIISPPPRASCTPPCEEIEQQHKQRDDQQQVNEAPRDMGQQTYEPQDYQHNDNRPEYAS